MTDITTVPEVLDDGPLELNAYIPPISGCYRRMPAATPEALGDERHCDRNERHILTFRGREIVCERCPARWRDEGF